MIPFRHTVLRALPSVARFSRTRPTTPLPLPRARLILSVRNAKPLQCRYTSSGSTTHLEDASAAAMHEDAVAAEEASQNLSPSESSLSSSQGSSQRPGGPAASRVYVGNLPHNITEDELRDALAQFGEVTHVNLKQNPSSYSASYGFVTFKDMSGVDQVMTSNVQLNGRDLKIDLPHTSRPAKQTETRDLPIEPTTTLFIGNISRQITDRELRELFKQLENVVVVRLAVDKVTDLPRGFAHVDFIDVASATEAMRKLEGKRFYDRPLRVNYAYSRQRNNDNR